MKKIGVFVVATLIGVAASAQDFQSWRKDTVQGYGECRLKAAATGVLRDSTPDDMAAVRECAEAKIAKSKEVFPAIQAKLKGNNAVFFKDHYAAWVGAMRALSSILLLPKDAASVSSYDTRQRLDELWARFEIEAGL